MGRNMRALSVKIRANHVKGFIDTPSLVGWFGGHCGYTCVATLNGSGSNCIIIIIILLLKD